MFKSPATTPDRQELLASVGLASGSAEHLHVSEAATARGFVRELLVSLATVLADPASHLGPSEAVRNSELATAGFTVDYAPARNGARGVFIVGTVDGSPLLVSEGEPAAGGSAPEHQADQDLPSVHYLRLREGQVLRLVRGDGTALALGRDDKGCFLATGQAGFQVEGLASLDGPVEEWAAACGDAPVARWVDARLRTREAYSVAAAAGMVMRLPRPTDEPRRNPLAPVPPTSALGRCVLWARGLTAAEVRTVARLAAAECRRLGRLADELDETLAFDEAGWLEELRALAHGRDDLEGVRAIVTEQGDAAVLAEVDSALARLDAQAEAFVYALPRGLLEGDERLERLAWVPGLWWVDPARGARA